MLRNASLFDRELRDYLRLALVEEVEVLFLESSDGVSLLVAHDDGNLHEIGGATESGSGIVTRHFGRILSGRLGLRRERRQEPEGQSRYLCFVRNHEPASKVYNFLVDKTRLGLSCGRLVSSTEAGWLRGV